MNRETRIMAIGKVAAACVFLLGAVAGASAEGQEQREYWDTWEYWGYGSEEPEQTGYTWSEPEVGGQYPGGGEQRFAVLVGINEYATGSNTLSGCVNDATGLRSAFLEDSARWSAANITLLTDGYASKYNIRSSLQQMGQSAGPGDVCVFAQSSHGGQYYGTSTFLVAYDDYYSDEELGADLANFFDEQTTVIVIVDACHAGGLFKEGANARAAAESLNSAFVQNVMAAYQNAKGGTFKGDSERSRALGGNIAFITAADYDETSSDIVAGHGFSRPQGLFMGNMIKAFQAMEADTGSDGQLSFWELYAWAAPRASEGQTAQTFNQPLLNMTVAAAMPAGAQYGGGPSGMSFVSGACGVMSGLPMLATLGMAGAVSCGRRRRQRHRQ